MKKVRIAALLLAVVMCMTALGACSGNKTETPTATSGESSATTPAQDTNAGTELTESGGDAQNEAATPAESEPTGEEVVYYATTTFEESWWDPARFTQVGEVGLASSIYENLVMLEHDGSVSPQLATSWDISDDGLTYTFHLRDDVTWHKGYGKFTSADVQFTLERQTDPAVESINAANLNVANIASIECPDDYTITLHLIKVDVDLLTKFAMYFANIVCKAHSDQDGVSSINTDPIGTGAFIFDGGTLGVKTEAVRNKEWWGDFTGNVDRVINTFIGDTNVYLSAFDNGELTSAGLYDKDTMKLYEDRGYNVVSIPLLQLLYVGVNMQIAPFDNPTVREAFFNAIDVQYFLDNLYYGTESAVGSYIPPGCKYALLDYFKFNYDPEKSKSLLAEAGYPDGLPIVLWGASDALGQPAAILVQDQLSKAGFKVELQCVDFGVFIDQVRNGTAPMWVLYNNSPSIADETINRYTSSFYPGNNWCGVMDPEYDALVAEGLAASTEAEKYEKFYAAQKRLTDLQVLYPVSTFSFGAVYQNNVSGIIQYADNAARYHTVTIS